MNKDKDIINKRIFVHLFHIFFVGILFLYVGINRQLTNKYIFQILFYLGFIIIFYHLYKVYKYLKEDKGIWVNLLHIFIIGPLLIYIGYNSENTSRKWFEILLMLGFASIGYHLYYLLV
jgi:hypothetical protein